MAMVITYIDEKRFDKFFHNKHAQIENENGGKRIVNVPNPVSYEDRLRINEWAQKQTQMARSRMMKKLVDGLLPFVERISARVSALPSALKMASMYALVAGTIAMSPDVSQAQTAAQDHNSANSSVQQQMEESYVRYAKSYDILSMPEKEQIKTAMQDRSEINSVLNISDAEEFSFTNGSNWSDAARKRMDFRTQATIDQLRKSGDICPASTMEAITCSTTESIQLEQILEKPQVKNMIKQQMDSRQVASAGIR